jgi:medium-chain acyl-[acyl-carrier-protein] hydrolase
MDGMAKMTKRSRLMITDVDFNNRIKMSAVFNYFQQIAGEHAQQLGIGFKAIEEQSGVSWVLTRMRVDMAKYPGWDEEVILETWPQLPKRYGFERDYLMRDLQGEVIARAVSEWVIIDIATRKLKRADTFAIDYPPIVIDRALDCVLGKINPPEEQRLIYKHTVGCSEIDLNGHLNNAKYIDYIDRKSVV